MALPTIKPYWQKNYRVANELAVRNVQRREDHRTTLQQASRFFQKNEVEADKIAAWSSEKSYKQRYQS